MFLTSLEFSNCKIPWISLINFNFWQNFPEQMTSTCSSTLTLCTCKVSFLKCYCSLTSNPSKFSLTSLAEILQLVTGSILPHRSRTWSVSTLHLQLIENRNFPARAPKFKKKKKKKPTDPTSTDPKSTDPTPTDRLFDFLTPIPTEHPSIQLIQKNTFLVF